MPRQSLLKDASPEELTQPVEREQTPQEKRKNWWYYHRAHLLAAVIGAALLFGILWSVFSKVKPDYTVALVTTFNMPQSGSSELARCLEQYGEDRNGDGRVVVNVAEYVFSTADLTTSNAVEQQQGVLARFVVDTAENESMLFFLDEEAFDFLENNFDGFFLYNDGTPMPTGARDYENARRTWEEIPALAAFVPRTEIDDAFTGEMLTQLFQRLGVFARSPAGYFEDDEADMAYFADSQELYRRLLNPPQE